MAKPDIVEETFRLMGKPGRDKSPEAKPSGGDVVEETFALMGKGRAQPSGPIEDSTTDPRDAATGDGAEGLVSAAAHRALTKMVLRESAITHLVRQAAANPALLAALRKDMQAGENRSIHGSAARAVDRALAERQ